MRKFETFAAAVEDAKRTPDLPIETFRAQTANVTPQGLPSADLNTLYSLDALARLRVTNAVRQTLKMVLTDRKIPPGAENAVQFQLNANNIISTDLLSGPESAVTLDLVRAYIVPNMVEDVAETRTAQQQAAGMVPDAKVTVLQGEVIVREGDVVTDEQVEKLEALGLRTPNLSKDARRGRAWHGAGARGVAHRLPVARGAGSVGRVLRCRSCSAR